MAAIIQALLDAGYDPYAQLYGYVDTGDPIYITRRGNAREMIQKLDKDDIARYVEKLKKSGR